MDSELIRRFEPRLRAVENEARYLRSILDQDAARHAAAAQPQPPETRAHAATQEPAPQPRAAQAPAAEAAAVAAVFAPSAGAPAAAAATREGSSLEHLIAGRGMQIVGSLLVLFGAAFFLKLAFDAGWIVPQLRVLLGVGIGCSLMFAGARTTAKAYVFLAEGIIGLGAGLIYLSLWAAAVPYAMISPAVGLIAMIAMTAALVVVARARNSERLALVGVVAGYLAPALLDASGLDRVALFAYLFVLNGGMLALAIAARFRFVEALAFVSLLFYASYFAIAGGDLTNAVTVRDLSFTTLFFLEFAAALVYAGRRDTTVTPVRLAVAAGSVLAYVASLEVDLAAHPHLLGGALLALGAILIATVSVRGIPQLLRTAYGWLGLGCVSLAIPSIFGTRDAGTSWAIEAAIVTALGARTRSTVLQYAGLALFFVGGALILTDAGVDNGSAMHPYYAVLNPRFMAFAILTAALGFAGFELRRAGRDGAPVAPALIAVVNVAMHVAALTGLSLEALYLGAGAGADVTAGFTSSGFFRLSLLWTFYAAGLFGAGLRTNSALLRWQGLALFAITIAKVFLLDLDGLELAYRVGSFLALGIVLVIASALYQRTVARDGRA